MEQQLLQEKMINIFNNHKTGKELVWGKIDKDVIPEIPTLALFYKYFCNVEFQNFKTAILALEKEGKIYIWHDDMRTKIGKAMNSVSLQQEPAKRKGLVDKIFSTAVTDDERFVFSAVCVR